MVVLVGTESNDNVSSIPHLLVVEDDDAFAGLLCTALEQIANVTIVNTLDDANHVVNNKTVDVVLTDIRLIEDGVNEDGLILLESLQQYHPALPVIVMTAFGDEAVSVRAMESGAFHYLAKPPDVEVLRQLVKTAASGRSQIKDLSSTLIYASRCMAKAIATVRATGADGQLNVLIQGETGVGKELLANELHLQGRRRNAPFIAFSLVGSNPQLIESDLFGHEKGAFTGADQQRLGYLEQANGGVLFIDEIDSLPLEGQAKLLRVLETRTFQRVGGQKPIKVDLQLVCASRRDLRDLVMEGGFRDDLLYRINTIELTIPPLRERGEEEIALLVAHFVKQLQEAERTEVTGLSAEALRILQRHDWPGNVRELRNVIDSAVLHFNQRGIGRRLLAVDLPEILQKETHPNSAEQLLPLIETPGFSLDVVLAKVEKHYIESSVDHFRGQSGSRGKASLFLYGERNRLARNLKRINSMLSDEASEGE